MTRNRRGSRSEARAMRVQPFEPGSLVGAVDPIEGTPLVAGETIWLCRDAKIGYHITSMTFLIQANGGRCVGCHRVHEFESIALPADPRYPIAWRDGRPGPPPGDAPARPRAATTTWSDRFDRVVRHVRLSPTGAYLLEFEPTQNLAADFRVVILPPSVPEWVAAGIDLESYQGRRIRTRGTIHDHPWWGRVMVVTEPGAISVLDRSTAHPVSWRPHDPAAE